MCFKNLPAQKRRMKSSKVPTESIQEADLAGLALSKKPKLNAQLSRVELGIAVALLLVLLGLRWFYVNAQPWDSDEGQHLHVVWAWANGMLPYKDVFDNHSPLFQAISAPLFALLGERADIVTAMRWTMVPIAGLILAMTYLIGVQLFSPRVGLWGALLTATFPGFYFETGEYRPDVFWTALWLITLAILTAGKPHPRRLFAAGLTFGIAFAVSMKTTFLALTLLTASVAVWLLRFAVPGSRSSPKMSGYHVIASFLAPVAGALIVPLFVVAFFA
jgi:Dolichyl-phosphate-mannose-protein mannosyltransferase